MKVPKIAACLLALSSYLGVATQAAFAVDLPSMGESSGKTMSPEQERRLGEAFMRAVRQRLTMIDDPEINAYVQSLGYRLVANSDAQSREFSFFVIKDPSINAFAAPGGFIGVHSGLILATESESELAAVLAHEIAHVTQNHLARTYEAADKLTLPTAAALLVAVLVGSQSSELGQAAVAATAAGSAQYQINFTRANEEEADRLGIQTLARSDFDPRSMPLFFERLQRSVRYYGDVPPEFLSTHPVTVSRIADSMGRAEGLVRDNEIVDSLAFKLARAKLRVIGSDNPQREVTLFEQRLADPPRAEEADRYGYALALTASGRSGQARKELTQLLKTSPDRIAYRMAMAQTFVGDRNFTDAIGIYRESLRTYPQNHAITMYYASALLQNAQPREAQQLLAQHLRAGYAEPELYNLLARAAGDAGSPAEAHQYLAEYHYLNGETASAIAQLELALRTGKLDEYQLARIDARLQQFKVELDDEPRR